MKTLRLLLPALLAFLIPASAQTPAADNGDAAWDAVQDLLAKPGEFFEKQRPTSRAEYDTAVAHFQELAIAAADGCAAFQKNYPQSRHRQDARLGELEMLSTLVRFGGPEDIARRLRQAEDALLADPDASADLKYMAEMRRAMEAAEKVSADGGDALTATEAALQPLLERYPDRGETYGVLLGAVDGAPPQRAIEVVKKILAAPKLPEDVKEAATGKLALLEAVGRPMPLQFTAIDGRKVDLAAMTNKVVLVDFWATWCGPCVREMPRMKRLFEQHHAKGFEIVGVSLDQDRAALEDFVKEKEIPWPQAFDGKGWQSDLARQFGISSIPALWLVDKKGKVVSTNARASIEEDLPRLLAE